MLFETRQVDQFEDWDGAIRGLKLQGCIRQGCIRLDDRGSIRIFATEGTGEHRGRLEFCVCSSRAWSSKLQTHHSLGLSFGLCERLCYADVCDECLPVPGVWPC